MSVFLLNKVAIFDSTIDLENKNFSLQIEIMDWVFVL